MPAMQPGSEVESFGCGQTTEMPDVRQDVQGAAAEYTRQGDGGHKERPEHGLRRRGREYVRISLGEIGFVFSKSSCRSA